VFSVKSSAILGRKRAAATQKNKPTTNAPGGNIHDTALPRRGGSIIGGRLSQHVAGVKLQSSGSVQLQFEDDRQVWPEIRLFFSSVAIKFNFE